MGWALAFSRASRIFRMASASLPERGAVPGLKARRSTLSVVAEVASRPVKRSTSAHSMPSGALKSSFSPVVGRAAFMKSIQMGSATLAPSAPLKIIFFSSRPTHTPQTILVEKPMNQPSVWSSVVPVLPATGHSSSLLRAPVPLVATPCRHWMSW